MIAEIFLVMALSPRPFAFAHAGSHAAITAYQMMKSEEERLRHWIHKNNPDAEIFIHHRPQEDKLKKEGWERIPFTWRGNKIWIQRKPATDNGKKLISTSA